MRKRSKKYWRLPQELYEQLERLNKLTQPLRGEFERWADKLKEEGYPKELAAALIEVGYGVFKAAAYSGFILEQAVKPKKSNRC